jgi:hypothetical protein
LRDPDLDVAGDAREATSPAGDRLKPDVARHRLQIRGAFDRTDAEVARDRVRGDVPVDPVEVGVAADRLQVRVSGDLAAQADVAGDGVDPERPEVPAELRVRRRRS